MVVPYGVTLNNPFGCDLLSNMQDEAIKLVRKELRKRPQPSLDDVARSVSEDLNNRLQGTLFAVNVSYDERSRFFRVKLAPTQIIVDPNKLFAKRKR